MNVIVVGGGFAGVKAALELSKRRVGKVTLISDESYFLHHATLYATATGKNTAESVIALKDIFAEHSLVTVVKDKIKTIDASRKIIIGGKKQYHYDEVVFALGSVTTYFGVQGLSQHAYGIKSLEDIKKFKQHIHNEVINKKLDKEYFVIGAGSTGVELAGALQEYLNYLKIANRLPAMRTRVTIVEAAPRVVPHASETAAKIVEKRLKKIGIRVLVNHKVDALDDHYISIEGKKVATTTVIWTAGVENNPFFKENDTVFHLAKNGRVNVNPFLQAVPHVYVIGDNNSVKYSGSAWPAMHQGAFVAKHIARVKHHSPKFGYHPRSVMFGLPVGEGWGYVERYGLYISGYSGFVARRLMELYGYTRLVPFQKAVALWRAHDIPQVDD